MTTGERIKLRRKQLAINADMLAARIGVSRSTVFRWEKGEIEKVPATKLNEIAQVLQTSVEYLIGWVDFQESNVVSPKKQALLNLVEQIPDDKADLFLSIAQSILADARRES